MTTTDVSKPDVKKLLALCSDARALYMHYRALFEPSSDVFNPYATIFSATSPIFFGDLRIMLVKCITLEVCKLGDPARDVRGHVNLSIDFFVRCSDFAHASSQFDQLQLRAGTLKHFIAKLKPARDKLLSHSDRDTLLSDVKLGGVNTDEWVDFWLELQDFVGLLCERYLGERVDFCSGARSDADGLVQRLRIGVLGA